MSGNSISILVSNMGEIKTYHRYFSTSPLVGDLLDLSDIGGPVLLIVARSWTPDSTLELHATEYYSSADTNHFARPYGNQGEKEL